MKRTILTDIINSPSPQRRSPVLLPNTTLNENNENVEHRFIEPVPNENDFYQNQILDTEIKISTLEEMKRLSEHKMKYYAELNNQSVKNLNLQHHTLQLLTALKDIQEGKDPSNVPISQYTRTYRSLAIVSVDDQDKIIKKRKIETTENELEDELEDESEDESELDDYSDLPKFIVKEGEKFDFVFGDTRAKKYGEGGIKYFYQQRFESQPAIKQCEGGGVEIVPNLFCRLGAKISGTTSFQKCQAGILKERGKLVVRFDINYRDSPFLWGCRCGCILEHYEYVKHTDASDH